MSRPSPESGSRPHLKVLSSKSDPPIRRDLASYFMYGTIYRTSHGNIACSWLHGLLCICYRLPRVWGGGWGDPGLYVGELGTLWGFCSISVPRSGGNERPLSYYAPDYGEIS